MAKENVSKLDKSDFIRDKLFDGETSSWKRYAMLVIGEPSFFKLMKYEFVTFLFGPVPGALGLALRKVFYPLLFSKTGAGVVFGRSVVIRNAHKISLGNGVVIDDYALLDARGSGDDGIVIGDKVIINRDVMLVSKVGPIAIGAGSDIGSRCMIISTGGIQIGENVTLAGDCKIGGSVAHLGGDGDSAQSNSKISKGKLIIGEGAILYMSVRVLDGVSIGRRAVIGSGISVQNNVPDDSIVAIYQKLVYLNRKTDSTREQSAPTQGPLAIPASDGEAGSADDQDHIDGRPTVVSAVFSAIDEINLLRSRAEIIAKSLDTSLDLLDSMDKVNLIVETEQKLSDHFGKPVQLDGQALMSNNEAVFSTVDTFVGEVMKLVSKQ